MSVLTQSDDCAVIALEQNLVASTANELREELKQLVLSGVKQLTIDMGSVEIVDSIGIGLLVAAHNSIPKPDGHLKLKNLNKDLLNLFRTMRLDRHFDIIAD